MVSRNAQLAIASLIELAKSERRMSATEVAEASGLSKPSVAKILSALRQGSFIVSVPGPGGGFALSREASAISIYEICLFFEMQTAMPDSCVITCGCTEDEPCKIHLALRDVENLRETTLRDITIETLLAA